MKIYLFTFILLFLSCGKNAFIVNKDNSFQTSPNIEGSLSELQEILTLVSGTFHDCVPSVIYSGYYSDLTHSLSGENVTTTETLSASSDCSSPYYEIQTEYKIVDASFTDSTKKTFNIDTKWQSYKINFKHSAYISRNYCGYTDWALNVTKELTGISCPTLLAYDNFHSSFLSTGDEKYFVYKIDSNELSIPVGNIESGDAANDRHNSQFLSIKKI